MPLFAKKLTAAFNDKKIITPQHLPAYPLGPRSKCHENAAKFVLKNGGQVVQGWIAEGAGYYTKHSIVDYKGQMIEVTNLNRNPLPFVRHDLFPEQWEAFDIFVTDCEAMFDEFNLPTQETGRRSKSSYMQGLLRLIK